MAAALAAVDGDMTRTITVLECDGCDKILLGCQDGHSNREMNTLAFAKKCEWVRVHERDGVKDYCPKCRVKNGS
jgi:hypothetical protein